jgi:hypothetical protein
MGKTITRSWQPAAFFQPTVDARTDGVNGSFFF